jgi:tetratricopeptide (TPR) repeat protein
LRVKALYVLLIAVCGFAAWRSIRIAIVDWVASAGTPEALERAIRFAPDRGELLARAAVYRNDSGDPSPGVDEDLQRAARLNPLNSSVLMTLGLREEFRGNGAKAEDYLVRAAELDHQFKPAWTLANYYYRTNQPGKGWPMIQRILNLEPLDFDLTPVFELCWKEAGNDPAAAWKILDLIPKAGQKPVQYLQFLIGTHRVDAALEALPKAVDVADPSDVATLTGFVDFLAGADRVQEAVTVWNQLVERGIVYSGRLDPAKGISIADPDFRFPPLPDVPNTFGWRVAEISGVFASGFSGSLRMEINGDEPQSFQILSAYAPVLSGAQYDLHWKSDGSALDSPRDPGFSFVIAQQPGDVITQCPPLLASDSPSCDFTALADTALADKQPGKIGKVRIDLRYTRAQGTTRVSGVLQLFGVRLERAQ